MWYKMKPGESLNEWRSRRLLECPMLSTSEIEVLTLLPGMATCYPSTLGIPCTRFEGWQVVNLEGLAVLDTLGALRP
jgi:hypothetical protein